MNDDHLLVTDASISRAWARVFLETEAAGRNEIVPLIVTVTGCDSQVVPEDANIRNALDSMLVSRGMQSCDTVAKTIFPHSLWNPGLSRDVLYRRYLHILPKLKREDSRNRYGTYFERLIHFDKGHSAKKRAETAQQINQLERIIANYQGGNRRRSAMQAAVFDPTVDQTNQPLRGFPCLHQVAFSPLPSGGLALTAFYATQYLFERAYGNYLGLWHLGLFMGQALELPFKRMTCVAAVAKRELPRKDVQTLMNSLRSMI